MGIFRRKSAGDVLEADEPKPTPEPHKAAVHAGVPGRCPRCDGFGYIDRLDMRYKTQSQHCRNCGFVWEFSFDDDGDVIDLTDSAITVADPADSLPR